jgi:hypothetical protein
MLLDLPPTLTLWHVPYLPNVYGQTQRYGYQEPP